MNLASKRLRRVILYISISILWVGVQCAMFVSHRDDWLIYNTNSVGAAQAYTGLDWEIATRRYVWGRASSGSFGIERLPQEPPEAGAVLASSELDHVLVLARHQKSEIAAERVSVGFPIPFLIHERRMDIRGAHTWSTTSGVDWLKVPAVIGVGLVISLAVDASSARVSNLLARRRAGRLKCPRCGYFLGVELAACPECGHGQ